VCGLLYEGELTLMNLQRGSTRTVMVFTGILIAGLGMVVNVQAADPPQSEKRALLVGCTVYPHHKNFRRLNGPVNDVALWRRLLIGKFGFAPKNITELVGWPDDPAARPTHDNLVKAFETLVAEARPGMSIFIQLSGHGMQVPIPEDQDPLDPKNPEPDGLDEVFLSADVTLGDLSKVLRDDQVGGWLDRLRAKGATVWIVFDCCHSGTMTRGEGSDRGEVSRVVDPADFGISNERIADSARRAAEAVRRDESLGKKPRDLEGTEIKAAPAGTGSLIAFYAAQPHEEAPELPQPETAPHTPENYYGLLSYCLVKSLEERESPMSYEELLRNVLARYRVERGTGAPTPSAMGDLKREVLGASRWPERRTITLVRDPDGWATNAGALRGFTSGSILAIRRAGGPADKAGTLVGYAKVESSEPARARVVLCEAPEGLPRPEKGATWKEGDRCEIVRQELGELRVQLYLPDDPNLKAAWEMTPPEVREMTQVVCDRVDAQWELLPVDPERARRDFGLNGMEGRHALLIQTRGITRSARDGKPAAHPKVFASLPLNSPEAISAGLSRDLPKIFKWQNVWRVAGEAAGTAQESELDLKFEMSLLKNRGDRSGGESLRSPVLHDGQFVEFRLRNEGQDDLWVSMLYLDANLRIKSIFEGSLGRRGKALAPIRMQMKTTDGSVGPEGMVVFALPMRIQKEQPSYAFLEQEPLGVIPRAVFRSGPETAFGRLLEAAALTRTTRGGDLIEATTPAVLTQTWTLSDDSH